MARALWTGPLRASLSSIHYLSPSSSLLVSLKLITVHVCIQVCVCVSAHAHTCAQMCVCHGRQVEVRRKLCGVSSLLPGVELRQQGCRYMHLY